jgi:RHS repeat-associated protein
VYRQENLYDLFGKELGNYHGNGNAWWSRMITFGSRTIAFYFSTYTRFVHANNLGTTAVVTDQSGGIQQDQLFNPWGQQWKTVRATQDLHFASLEQLETDLNTYPTPNRRYTSAYARWASPDPMAGDITNPQSFNRYAYVRNNPTTLTDPLGLGDCGGDLNYPCNGPPPPPGHEGGRGGGGVPSPGQTTCAVDQVEDPGCTTLAKATNGWTNAAFEVGVNQSIANSKVTVGYPYYWASPSSFSYQSGNVISMEDIWESGTLEFSYSSAVGTNDLETLVNGFNTLTTPLQNTIVSEFILGTGAAVVGVSAYFTGTTCVGTGGLGCGAAIIAGVLTMAGGASIMYSGYQYTKQVTIPSWVNLYNAIFGH